MTDTDHALPSVPLRALADLNNSAPGQAVCEPLMRSDTTLVAAETIGRVCLGVELNPADVDVERRLRRSDQPST